MGKHDNLDERQLLLRGNMYKHAFITLLLSLLGMKVLVDFGVLLPVGTLGVIPPIALSVAVFNIELVREDIYPGSEPMQRRYCVINLILSLGMFALCIVHLVQGDGGYVLDGQLTDEILTPITGIFFGAPAVYYIVHKLQQKEDKDDA